MQISVLIPSYNYEVALPATLAPLLADPASGEVIVVVDGSQDDSFALLQRMARTEPRLRPFYIENRGRTGAWQFGLEQARHDVVLSIDQDVVAHDGMVSGHAAHHADGRNQVVVGYMPTIRTPPGPGSFVIERYADEYERVCAQWERDPGTILRRFWGGNMSIRRDDLLAAGGCDTGVGLRYSHDQELGMRLLEHGLDAVFDRRLRAEHHFERSVSGFLKSGRHQGHDLVIIEQLHPGRASFPQWRSSGGGAALRRIARRSRGYAAISWLGFRLLIAAGRLGTRGGERRIGEFLQSVELQQGMLERRRMPPASDSAVRARRGGSTEVVEGSDPVPGQPLAPAGRA